MEAGHDIYTIGSVLAGVNTRRNADLAAKELLPLVNDLEKSFNAADARRSLDREHYKRLVDNANVVNQHITHLRKHSFHQSTTLAHVCHKLQRFLRETVL